MKNGINGLYKWNLNLFLLIFFEVIEGAFEILINQRRAKVAVFVILSNVKNMFYR